MAERVHSQDIYIHESVDFEIARRWMWINCKDVDSISVEIISKRVGKTLFNVLYRLPNGFLDPFEKFSREF